MRNSFTRFLLMISVWIGLNSGLDDEMELLLLESLDEGIFMENVEEADDDTEVDIVDELENKLKSHIAAVEGLLVCKIEILMLTDQKLSEV